jgi:hypothetical protein
LVFVFLFEGWGWGAILGIETRAPCMLGKHSTIELSAEFLFRRKMKYLLLVLQLGFCCCCCLFVLQYWGLNSGLHAP